MHGLHLSPEGNSDNVLVTLPPGEAFVYEYQIAEDQAEGLNWLHNHRHEFTTDQVYRGLSSMLIVGDKPSGINDFNYLLGKIPLFSIPNTLPDRAMALQYQLLGQNSSGQYLQDFTNTDGSGINQVTVNGLLNPTITVGPGQTEVWSLANMSPNQQISVKLVNMTTNTPLPLIQVAQDGNALGSPFITPAGQQVTIAPGARYSFLVTASDKVGEKVSLVYTSKAVKTSTQLVTMTSDLFLPSQFSLATPSTLTSNRFFDDLSLIDIPTTRKVKFSQTPGGGATAQFFINEEVFPDPAIFQPRLGTIEQWELTNTSGIAHPFHIHVNPFQVMSSNDPTGSLPNITSPEGWNWDVINVPPAKTDPTTKVVTPGKVVIRLKPIDYTGTFVYHCHILPHEDRGMMALVSIKPAIPIIATGAGPGATPEVKVYNSLTSQKINSIMAFDPAFTGGVRTAVADVNNDSIDDLIMGAGPGGGPRVRVLDGASGFQKPLYDFFAFESGFRGGVHLSAADFNGDSFEDIVVGAGAGGGPAVAVFDGKTGKRMTQFFAYDSKFRGGVTVATGAIDDSGFDSLITGPGAGGGPQVRTWQNPHFYQIGSAPILPGQQSIRFEMTGQFLAFDAAYRGGVQVSTGLNAGSSPGGFYRILSAAMRSSSRVTVWECTTAPHSEAMPMSGMDLTKPMLDFKMSASFFAFSSTGTAGVQVGSVAVSQGSDLLVATTFGTSTRVKRFSLLPGVLQPTLVEEFTPFGIDFKGGASVSGTN